MVDRIGLRREDERGRTLAEFAADGTDDLVRLAPPDSHCLQFIDPYGDTLFNQVQLPVLIAEVERVLPRATSAESRQRLAAVLAFLEESRHTHQYVRFVGD